MKSIRAEIKKELFDLAESGDPVATIECTYLAGMYTSAQREDYYNIKQWSEEIDNA